MSRKVFGTIVCVVFLLLAGCAHSPLHIGQLDPNPMVDVADRTEPIALELGAKVKDEFVIPENSGIRQVNVTAWHATLRGGFENAFGASTVEGNDGAGLQIVLSDVRFDFVGDVVYAGGGAAAVRARLRFLGHVVDGADGSVVQKLGGEIISQQIWTTTGGEVVTATEVVEKLFQHVATKLPRGGSQ